MSDKKFKKTYPHRVAFFKLFFALMHFLRETTVREANNNEIRTPFKSRSLSAKMKWIFPFFKKNLFKVLFAYFNIYVTLNLCFRTDNFLTTISKRLHDPFLIVLSMRNDCTLLKSKFYTLSKDKGRQRKIEENLSFSRWVSSYSHLPPPPHAHLPSESSSFSLNLPPPPHAPPLACSSYSVGWAGGGGGRWL